MRTRSAIYQRGGITILAAFLVVSAVGEQSPTRPAAEVGATEYEVLSPYIAGTFTRQQGKERVGDDISKIVIVNVTQSDEHDPLLDDNGKPTPWKKLSKSL